MGNKKKIKPRAQDRCDSPLVTLVGGVSEGSFVRNVVVQIPKFDAKANPNSNRLRAKQALYPMPIPFGQMTLLANELLPFLLPNKKLS